MGLFLSLTFISLQAQVFDTVTVKQVGDGVKHLHIVEHNKPWDLYVLEVALKNPYISMETVKGRSNSHYESDSLYGNENPDKMARRIDAPGHRVMGGINADFFGTGGIACGFQVANGEIVNSSPYSKRRTTLAFDSNNKPYFSRNLSFSGKVIANGIEKNISNVNQNRGTNSLVLFNRYRGLRTRTNNNGTEVVLLPLNELVVNGKNKCVVEAKNEDLGYTSIEPGKLVLSGIGTAKTFLEENMNVGDTIEVYSNITPHMKNITQLACGLPRIIKDGVNYGVQGYTDEGGTNSFATDRHPRTAAGFSKDSTTLYLVVVDGRQSSSRGMSLPELADFMMGIGAYNAVNFDGGGSSAITVHDHIVNSPSGGATRAVGNGLFVVSSEPIEVSDLTLYPDSVVTVDKDITFWHKCFDKYGWERPIKSSEVNFELSDPSVGTISQSGTFSPSRNGLTKVIMNYKGLSDTAFVCVENIHDTTITVTSFETLPAIEITGDNINIEGSSVSLETASSSHGNSSLKVNYKFTYQSGKQNIIYLNTAIPVIGIPDSVLLEAKTDSEKHKIALFFGDENDEEFLATTNTYVTETEDFQSLYGNMKKLISVKSSNELYYPLYLKKIAIQLGCARESGTEYSGEILIDNIRMKYPIVTGIRTKDNIDTPSSYSLSQNYPNPFNPTTKIDYSLSNNNFVSIKVFDVLGREVASLVNSEQAKGTHSITFNASNLSSGIYFYRIKAGEFELTKQMLLLK